MAGRDVAGACGGGGRSLEEEEPACPSSPAVQQRPRTGALHHQACNIASPDQHQLVVSLAGHDRIRDALVVVVLHENSGSRNQAHCIFQNRWSFADLLISMTPSLSLWCDLLLCLQS
jgi:hypothetical protein